MIKVRCEGEINTFWTLDTDDGVMELCSIDGESPKDENYNPVNHEIAVFLWDLLAHIDSSNEEFATIAEFTDDGEFIKQYLEE